MCVHVYVCMHVYVCCVAYIDVLVDTRMYAYACGYMYVHTYMCKCVNAHIDVDLCIHMHTCMYICSYVCLYVCFYAVCICVLYVHLCACLYVWFACVCVCFYAFKLLPLNHREAKTDMVFRISSTCLNYVYVLGVYVGMYIYVQVPAEARRGCQVPLKLG